MLFITASIVTCRLYYDNDIRAHGRDHIIVYTVGQTKTCACYVLCVECQNISEKIYGNFKGYGKLLYILYFILLHQNKLITFFPFSINTQ